MPPGRYSLAALLSVLTTCAAVSITPKGQTVEVNGNTYYVPPTVVTTLTIPGNYFGQHSESAGTLVPLTVIQSDSQKLTASTVQSIVDGYEKADDVFNAGFLESIFLLIGELLIEDDCLTDRLLYRCLHLLQW